MNKDNIEEILKDIGAEAVPADVHKIARETSNNFSKSLAESQQPQRRILLERIMKSRIPKLAAAAVIAIGVLYALNWFDRDSVAWAELIEHVQKIKTVAYQAKMKMKGLPGLPEGRTMEGNMQARLAYEQGFRINTSINVDNKEIETTTYVVFEEGTVYSVIPAEKKYIKMKLTEELLAKMEKENSDPRTTLKQMMEYDYTLLGRDKIDGIEVEGIEVTDPNMALQGGGMFDLFTARLWCDVKTDLPVLMTMQGSANNGETVLDITMDNFQWDVEINPVELEPNIPEDYKLLAETEFSLGSSSGKDFVEALEFFAKYTGGKYPSSLSGMTIMNELTDALTRKFRGGTSPSEPNQADMSMYMKLQTIGMTYAMMIQDGNDPAYYGDKVTAEFPHAVLMRWKIAEGAYRVILGDLTIRDVPPEELAELEALPLNINPYAIKPQPAKGATVFESAEVELSWMPGAFVNEHKVYIGTATDQLRLLGDVADECSVIAPALEKATTYYWRVDEVQPDGSVATGDVWSFDTGRLVGWWKLDGDASDSSGNRNHGIVSGHPNLVTGPTGTALQFDGEYDDVRTDYATDLATWTVAVWVNSPAAPSSAAPAGPVHRENNLQINWNHSFADFRGAAALRVAENWYAASFGDLAADTWYHLAATYDGENLKAYKNGVLMTDNPDPSGAPDEELATLKFARHSVYGDHFEGAIDDVRIYSYALSAEEVDSIFEARPEQR